MLKTQKNLAETLFDVQMAKTYSTQTLGPKQNCADHLAIIPAFCHDGANSFALNFVETTASKMTDGKGVTETREKNRKVIRECLLTCKRAAFDERSVLVALFQKDLELSNLSAAWTLVSAESLVSCGRW